MQKSCDFSSKKSQLFNLLLAEYRANKVKTFLIDNEIEHSNEEIVILS